MNISDDRVTCSNCHRDFGPVNSIREAYCRAGSYIHCCHEKSLRYAYLFSRAGYGNIVTFECRECGETVTHKFDSQHPFRNWTTPNYREPWNNVGGPRKPELCGCGSVRVYGDHEIPYCPNPQCKETE